MRILQRLEPQAPLPQLDNKAVGGGGLSAVASAKADNPGRIVRAPAGVSAAGYSFASGLFRGPKTCPAHERHVRRPGWTELFFDLVFAAAVAQLSAPLDHDYSVHGIGRFVFLLVLVFFAWFGYATFSTQFGVDDLIQRAFIVAQVVSCRRDGGERHGRAQQQRRSRIRCGIRRSSRDPGSAIRASHSSASRRTSR
jgi:hypothetical protein